MEAKVISQTKDSRSQSSLTAKSLTLKHARSSGRGGQPESPVRIDSDIAHLKLSSETDKEYIADLFARFCPDDEDGASTLADDWVSNLDAIVSHNVKDRKRQNQPCSTIVQISDESSEDDALPPSAMPATSPSPSAWKGTYKCNCGKTQERALAFHRA